MNSNDKFDFFPASTANPVGKYTQPKVNTNAPYARAPKTIDGLAISAGNFSKKGASVASPEVKVRGGKAQTKGKMARGPMA